MVTKKTFVLRLEFKSLLLLAGLTVIYFWKILFTHEYSLLTSNDNARAWYPWYQFATYWLKRGVWPLWDPYTLSGTLYIGEAQPGLFYPFNLLAFFFAGNATGLSAHRIEATIIFSVFLLASFQYLLARVLGLSPFAAIVSAMCYAFAGFTGTIFFGPLGMLNSALWTPAVFLFFLKAREAPNRASRLFLAMTAGLCLAMGILAGHIVPPMYAVCILALYAGYSIFSDETAERSKYKTRLGMVLILGIVLVTAAGAAAVQLIPSAEYTKYAIRWVATPEPMNFRDKIPYEAEGTYEAFPLYNLIGFLIPNLAYVSNIYIYIGLLPLILCVIAVRFGEDPRIRFFFYLAVLSLLYILGNTVIVHGLAYVAIPFLYVARIAHRALFITHFALAVLAGFGMDFLLRRLHEKSNLARVRRLVRRVAMLAAALMTVTLLGALGYYLEGKIPAKADPLNNIFYFLLMLSLTVGLLYTVCDPRTPTAVVKALTIGLLVVDLFSPISAATPLKSKFDGKENFELGQYYRRTKILAHILEDKEPFFRVDNVTENPPAYGDMFNLFTTYGIAPTMLKDYHRFRSSDWFGANVLKLLGVKYVISKNPIPGLEKIITEGDVALYANKNYLPRAFVVPKAKLVSQEQDILNLINSESFDPRAYILLSAREAAAIPAEDRPESVAADAGAGSDARILQYTPKQITLEVEAATRGFLFLSEVYYPGWQAYVDGQPTSILKANYTFRAMAINQGKHRVEMIYAPVSFKIGATITLLTVGLWISVALAIAFRIIVQK